MKTSILLVISSAILTACSNPENTIIPASSGSQTSSVVESGKAEVSKLSPIIQITNYYAVNNGESSVTLNGRQLTMSWQLKNSYAYDSQHRLIRQTTTARNNSNWWEELSYQYTPDLTQRYRNSENKDMLNILLLNERGYIKGNEDPDEYVYNEDGYLIRYRGNNQQDTYTIKDGNVVARETVFNSGSVQRNTYEYDLTKPGLPSPLTFRGQQSKNLLTKQTLVTTDTKSSASDTNVFVYSYDTDKQGRPIREFVIANTEPSPRSIREFIYQ